MVKALTYAPRAATLTVFVFLLSLCIQAQQDTIVTHLREITVVGSKQSAESEIGAATQLSRSEIQNLNVVSMKDVSEIVPNFYSPAYGSRMTSSIYVRGLGTRIDQPVVGLTVDGVPFLNKDNYDFDLFDIDRIEILRGAQSILNGRNTMAGQINITTISPRQYQGWRMMAEYGRANSVKGAVAWYGKLHDELYTSVSAYYTGTDGFFRNEYNNGRLDKENQGSLRWKLSWHPTPYLSVANTAAGQVSRQGGYPYRNVSTGKIAYNDTCFYRRNSFSDGLTVGWTGKRVTVTSQTSVQLIHDNMTLDQDFTPQPYFTLTQKRQEYALTEDLYAKGRRGNVKWLGGVFGFYKHTNMQAPVTFKDYGISQLIEAHPNAMNPTYPIAWDTRRFTLGSDFLTITKGFALYEQTSYSHGPWLFEMGLRWDIEFASLSYLSHCDTGYTTFHVLPNGDKEVYSHTPVQISDRGYLSQSFNELLPKIAVSYTFGSGTQLYANASKGYKAGGYNVQMFSDVLQQQVMELMGLTMKYDIDEIVSYKPEKSWNFETGVKADIPNAGLRIDGDVFYILCTDQQLTVFPPGTTTGRMMTNAGKTRSYGVEASLTYTPHPSLTLRGSYGYTNARFIRYDNGRTDYAGMRLPYVPSHTAFASMRWQTPLSLCGVKPELDLSVKGVGDICWNEDNDLKQPFYAICSASILFAKDAWSLRLWGENLSGTKYDTFYFVSIGNSFVQQGRPVVWGATLRLNL